MKKNKDPEDSNRNSSTLKTDFSPSINPPAQVEDPNSPQTLKNQKYDSRWKQQTLHACRQNLSVINIAILYLTLGVVFMSVGGVSYYFASNYPTVIEQDYTHCKSSNKTDLSNNITNASGEECFPRPKGSTRVNYSITKSIRCVCKVRITVREENLPPDEESSLVLYFKLTKFHQNIRQYKREQNSRYWEYIRGKVNEMKPLLNKSNFNSNCRKGDKSYYPCGTAANSYFSDRFKIFNSDEQELPLDFEKIAWQSDEKRFGKPDLKGMKITDEFNLPKGWHDGLKEEFINENKGVTDKNFIVWMRSAAINEFRKKYAHIRTLRKTGNYTVEVQYRYEVNSFRGAKKIVIAVDSNNLPVDYFFFYWYIAVGATCLLFVPLMYLTKCVYHAFHKSSSSSKNSNQAGRLVPGAEHATSQNIMEDPSHTEHPSSVSVKT